MTGAPALRLSDYVYGDVMAQCEDPGEECENSASDVVQLNVEVCAVAS